MIWRSISRGGRQAEVVQELMQRQLIQHGETQDKKYCVIVPNESQAWHTAYWSTSLSIMGAPANLHLARAGLMDNRSQVECPISDWAAWLPRNVRFHLAKLRVRQAGDLITQDPEGHAVWADLTRLPGMPATDINLQDRLGETFDITTGSIAPGQFWIIDSPLGRGKHGIITEILAVKPNKKLRIRQW